MARKYDSIFELEESLFGDWRLTHRWKEESGEAGVERYHGITLEEAITIMEALEESNRKLHLL